MGILDDLIKDIDEPEKKKENEGDKGHQENGGEEKNANGMPSDWYSDEFRKFAGIESI